MKLYSFPSTQQYKKLSKRPVATGQDLRNVVLPIFESIQTKGDLALQAYSAQFDGWSGKKIQVSAAELAAADKQVAPSLKKAIKTAKQNITKFHKAQMSSSKKVETTKGVFCWRENRGIEKVGLYIPGGTAPLFSTLLMLAIPAQLAGCKEIVVCTPPDKHGHIHPAILFTASLLGLKQVYKVGGAQAIAAMTFGTKTIPAVYKIFGPGNQYVTAAKILAQDFGVAIDMPAGPSEVLVIADDSCNPAYVAADLLSQAEHGLDSQVILVSNQVQVITAVQAALQIQIEQLPRKTIVEASLKNSKAILLESVEACVQFSNVYAPEHLIIATKNAVEICKKIINAGSVFIGNYSCESAGDYASGTNHTLPTNGFAKNYSGVSLDSFVKKITFQQLTKAGVKNLAPTVAAMAAAEQLDAHKNAILIRMQTS